MPPWVGLVAAEVQAAPVAVVVAAERALLHKMPTRAEAAMEGAGGQAAGAGAAGGAAEGRRSVCGAPARRCSCSTLATR